MSDTFNNDNHMIWKVSISFCLNKHDHIFYRMNDFGLNCMFLLQKWYSIASEKLNLEFDFVLHWILYFSLLFVLFQLYFCFALIWFHTDFVMQKLEYILENLCVSVCEMENKGDDWLVYMTKKYIYTTRMTGC